MGLKLVGCSITSSRTVRRNIRGEKGFAKRQQGIVKAEARLKGKGGNFGVSERKNGAKS